MRVLVLGASGGCGRWLARIATARGHDVTALVRAAPQSDEVRDALGGARIIEGNVLDPQALERAVRGQQIVLCALGIRRAGRSPWAPLQSPPDFVATAVRGLIPAMQRAGIARLSVISAAGVGDSVAHLSWAVQRLIGLGNVAVAYRDLAAMEALLPPSGLEWQVVRPVTLVEGSATGAARPVDRYTMLSTIRRADVAHWMMEQAESRAAAAAPRFVLLGT